MHIAIAQINTVVGDIDGNTSLIVDAIRRARDEFGADLVVFPEMAVLGYPPKDLLLKERVVERVEEAMAVVACECTSITAVVGGVRRTGLSTGTGRANSAALCRNGHVEAWYDKRLLPTYDVFDEDRYFDPGTGPLIFDCSVADGKDRRVGVTICEDLWNDSFQESPTPRLYVENIVAELAEEHVDLILNLSASPFWVGKPEFRHALFGRAARRIGVPIVFANLVGANDDLIFDGHSAIYGPDDSITARSPGFDDGLLTVDLPDGPVGEPNTLVQIQNGNANDSRDTEMSNLFQALALGVRDYVRKCGFSSVIVALSGGIDSAVVAAIAAAALGSENVWGVGLPSRYSSKGSIKDAQELADRFGFRFDLISIESAHKAMLELLTPIFETTGQPAGVAEENIQARLRGNLVMALSNKVGALLLTTGNKSELAVGYCTLYGDMAGGLAVISDVPKTMVYDLAKWMNEHPERFGLDRPPIPDSTIMKPPSAELKPNQTDQDTLPSYDILDRIVNLYVERHFSVERIIEETDFEPEVVQQMCQTIDRNEYKRRQMPTGLKVTGRAFGSGWRMPIAAKFL